MNLLRNAVEASFDDGWASLATIGHIVTKQRPDFDARTYGYIKLSDLIAATTLFDLDRRTLGDGKPAVIYARDKRHLS
ncbi:OST-HTH/LOTUS domain-containing protein [Nonomuraea jabiensis]|uniref:OST-HTH/LOTUS domain-containing protein n=1 Tax=Nonomuraea jabiensis TaxID=882448 RepID=UPI0034415AF3